MSLLSLTCPSFQNNAYNIAESRFCKGCLNKYSSTKTADIHKKKLIYRYFQILENCVLPRPR